MAKKNTPTEPKPERVHPSAIPDFVEGDTSPASPCALHCTEVKSRKKGEKITRTVKLEMDLSECVASVKYPGKLAPFRPAMVAATAQGGEAFTASYQPRVECKVDFSTVLNGIAEPVCEVAGQVKKVTLKASEGKAKVEWLVVMQAGRQFAQAFDDALGSDVVLTTSPSQQSLLPPKQRPLSVVRDLPPEDDDALPGEA